MMSTLPGNFLPADPGSTGSARHWQLPLLFCPESLVRSLYNPQHKSRPIPAFLNLESLEAINSTIRQSPQDLDCHVWLSPDIALKPSIGNRQ